jgi:Flp pilus assembly protein TadG
MNQTKKSFLLRLFKDQTGQVLPWMALMMVLFLGMGGLTVDLGHAYVCYRELQASTDAAALAGAYAMSVSGATLSTVTSEVDAYSSLQKGAGTQSGLGANANSNLGNVTLSGPTLKCVATSVYVSVPCAAPTGDNVVQVTQSAVVPMYFIQALKAFGNLPGSSITLHATSTAAMESGPNKPLNLAIIIDTTSSMNNDDDDAACGSTEIYCALQGMQTLLGSLSPCTTGSSKKAGCLAPFDQVSLFTFPNIQANNANDDTACPTGNPSIPAYSAPAIPGAKNTTWNAPSGASPTYQVTTYEDDYSNTNQAGGGIANTPLGIASGADNSRNCGGLQAPGGDGTYIAGSMYAAMTSLQAQQAANPNSTSAMILLSDGGANSSRFGSGFSSSSGTYPSTIDQCQQTVAAGQYATNTLGIAVYTVAYGASTDSSQCTTDKGKSAISPCSEMQEAASSAANFYSDATAQENKGQCISSANPSLSLNQIFTSIQHQFSAARMVPNSVF